MHRRHNSIDLDPHKWTAYLPGSLMIAGGVVLGFLNFDYQSRRYSFIDTGYLVIASIGLGAFFLAIPIISLIIEWNKKRPKGNPPPPAMFIIIGIGLGVVAIPLMVYYFQIPLYHRTIFYEGIFQFIMALACIAISVLLIIFGSYKISIELSRKRTIEHGEVKRRERSRTKDETINYADHQGYQLKVCSFRGYLTGWQFGPAIEKELETVNVYLLPEYGTSLIEALGIPWKKMFQGKWVKLETFSDVLAKIEGLLINNRVSPKDRSDIERVIEWLKARVEYCKQNGKLHVRADLAGYKVAKARPPS